MPGGDRTGPGGMGPMTGRAAGFCAGYPVAGYMNPIPGRGFGFGRGGFGHRNLYYATGLTGWQRAAYGYPAWGNYGWAGPYAGTPVSYGTPYGLTKEQETDVLKNQAKYIEEALASINKRIQELDTKKKS
jgi:hypothetical protein